MAAKKKAAKKTAGKKRAGKKRAARETVRVGQLVVGEPRPVERRGDVPDAIWIDREEGYRTHAIGRAAGGQFMAFVVATLPPGPPGPDWRSQKRWYAVLHRFDLAGRHLETVARFAGTTSDGEAVVLERARSYRDELMAPLVEAGAELRRVRVQLFAVQVEDRLMGLVDGSAPEEGIHKIDLWPNDLAFFAPWDGSYST